MAVSLFQWIDDKYKPTMSADLRTKANDGSTPTTLTRPCLRTVPYLTDTMSDQANHIGLLFPTLLLVTA
ncbi:hypothetical protein CLV58_1417 [Spirosoma oryzae]|uniref:Uncharacterized protein n=1 Tax=Spirosoma oryzae TaxID=1469603 RepID=A0A2T0RQL4_9BACT|nr:hypothetical protein CLV58_1417 [Spirosoma oryzae]